LESGETVSLIRAFNVLRQYNESEVAQALAALAAPLTENGLIIEGTSDPLGRLLTFNLYQKVETRDRASLPLQRIAFVLAPSLRADFAPRQFQAVLPKNFIHHAEPGGAIDRFFAAWHAAWQRARANSTDPRQVFVHAAHHLADHYSYSLDRRPALLRRGFLSLGPNWPMS
jgi:hypothetical protein